MVQHGSVLSKFYCIHNQDFTESTDGDSYKMTICVMILQWILFYDDYKTNIREPTGFQENDKFASFKFN